MATKVVDYKSAKMSERTDVGIIVFSERDLVNSAFFSEGQRSAESRPEKNILNILLSSNKGRNVITSLVIWLRIYGYRVIGFASKLFMTNFVCRSAFRFILQGNSSFKCDIQLSHLEV